MCVAVSQHVVLMKSNDRMGSGPARFKGERLAARITMVVAVMALIILWAQPIEAAPGDTPSGLISQEITFRGSGGITLHGLIVAPTSAERQRPGVVLVHGAGPHLGTNYLSEAEAFARAGIVALIYNKRTEGYSMMERSYSTLADDVLAAVQVLRERPQVDPTRVGVWGLSEGGWVAPLAASRSADVAFVITVAGTATFRLH